MRKSTRPPAISGRLVGEQCGGGCSERPMLRAVSLQLAAALPLIVAQAAERARARTSAYQRSASCEAAAAAPVSSSIPGEDADGDATMRPSTMVKWPGKGERAAQAPDAPVADAIERRLVAPVTVRTRAPQRWRSGAMLRLTAKRGRCGLGHGIGNAGIADHMHFGQQRGLEAARIHRAPAMVRGESHRRRQLTGCLRRNDVGNGHAMGAAFGEQRHAPRYRPALPRVPPWVKGIHSIILPGTNRLQASENSGCLGK